MTVVTIQQRRATSTEWSTKNPILKAGEIGFEIDTGKFKCGNGVTPWDSLNYVSGIEDAPMDGKSYVRRNGAWVEVTLP